MGDRPGFTTQPFASGICDCIQGNSGSPPRRALAVATVGTAV